MCRSGRFPSTASSSALSIVFNVAFFPADSFRESFAEVVMLPVLGAPNRSPTAQQSPAKSETCWSETFAQSCAFPFTIDSIVKLGDPGKK